MRIEVVGVRGSGATADDAYQDALVWSGLADFNLITIPGIIPSGAVVCRVTQLQPRRPWGACVHVASSIAIGAEASVTAGIGWVQDGETGKGFCVSQTGADEAWVRSSLETRLSWMSSVRGLDRRDPQIELMSATPYDEPVCALVVASFSSLD